MAEELALRSQYLTNAAHLLAVTSPAAASFLGRARHRLLEETEAGIPERQQASLRREVCGACGNLMIPGWSCKVSNQAEKRPHISKDKVKWNPPRAVESNIVYTCLRCNRQTSQAQQRQPRRSMKSSRNPPAMERVRHEALPERLSKTTNVSSKQRQKARKGGLAAMLEKNKTQQSNKGGLDLLDFAM